MKAKSRLYEAVSNEVRRRGMTADDLFRVTPGVGWWMCYRMVSGGSVGKSAVEDMAKALRVKAGE